MMKKTEFEALQLRASICPSLETEWEPPKSYTYWAHLHEAANELREVVGHARAGVASIEQDKDLAPDARKRKKHELARQTMTQLEKLSSIAKARQSVAAIQARWQAKIDSVMVRPTADDAATATLFWEIRDRFGSLKDERARISWIQRYGNDPLVPSALLHGPAALTNLSEAERALLLNKVEALADPKITAAKGKVTKALAELERGFLAAPAMVAQCAGLNKAVAARPLPPKPELPTLVASKAPPKAITPKPTTPPKADRPNWPSNLEPGSPATASGPGQGRNGPAF